MTISKFVNSYNLHDSLLETIVYNKTTKKVILFVDFCYWQQENYNDDMNETGMILIEFDGVTSLKYTPHQINSDEIVSVSYKDDEIIIKVFNDILNDTTDIIIQAKTVTVSKHE